MAHDYVVAQLSSGIGVTQSDVQEFINFAVVIKQQSKQKLSENH